MLRKRGVTVRPLYRRKVVENRPSRRAAVPARTLRLAIRFRTLPLRLRLRRQRGNFRRIRYAFRKLRRYMARTLRPRSRHHQCRAGPARPRRYASPEHQRSIAVQDQCCRSIRLMKMGASNLRTTGVARARRSRGRISRRRTCTWRRWENLRIRLFLQSRLRETQTTARPPSSTMTRKG
jgi:hypothetical protein